MGSGSCRSFGEGGVDSMVLLDSVSILSSSFVWVMICVDCWSLPVGGAHGLGPEVQEGRLGTAGGPVEICIDVESVPALLSKIGDPGSWMIWVFPTLVVISCSGDSITGCDGAKWFSSSEFVGSVGSGTSAGIFSPTVVLTESSGDAIDRFDGGKPILPLFVENSVVISVERTSGVVFVGVTVVLTRLRGGVDDGASYSTSVCVASMDEGRTSCIMSFALLGVCDIVGRKLRKISGVERVTGLFLLVILANVRTEVVWYLLFSPEGPAY